MIHVLSEIKESGITSVSRQFLYVNPSPPCRSLQGTNEALPGVPVPLFP